MQITANENFARMQATLRDLREAADKAFAVSPASTRRLLDNFRAELSGLRPLTGEPGYWPYPFSGRRMAICRAALWVSRLHPFEVYFIVVKYHELFEVVCTETAD